MEGHTESPEPTTPRMPSDVLVVEDNYLIALDAEDMLRQFGVANVRVAHSVEQALEWIAARPPDFCLLDVVVGEVESFEVADVLLGLAIPFAFATGYGDRFAFPPRFAQARLVTKPYSLAALTSAIFAR